MKINKLPNPLKSNHYVAYWRNSKKIRDDQIELADYATIRHRDDPPTAIHRIKFRKGSSGKSRAKTVNAYLRERLGVDDETPKIMAENVPMPRTREEQQRTPNRNKAMQKLIEAGEGREATPPMAGQKAVSFAKANYVKIRLAGEEKYLKVELKGLDTAERKAAIEQAYQGLETAKRKRERRRERTAVLREDLPKRLTIVQQILLNGTSGREAKNPKNTKNKTVTFNRAAYIDIRISPEDDWTRVELSGLSSSARADRLEGAFYSLERRVEQIEDPFGIDPEEVLNLSKDILFDSPRAVKKTTVSRSDVEKEVIKYYYNLVKEFEFVTGGSFTSEYNAALFIQAVKRELYKLFRKYKGHEFFVRLDHEYKGLAPYRAESGELVYYGGFAMNRVTFDSTDEIDDQIGSVLTDNVYKQFTQYLTKGNADTRFRYTGFTVEITLKSTKL